MLSIDDILSANDSEVREIPCPEWGGSVYVRTLTADERDELDNLCREEGASARATIASKAMCDEQGNPISVTKAQIKALGKKSAGPIERMVDAVLEMNGMRANDLETAGKNSGTTPDDASG